MIINGKKMKCWQCEIKNADKKPRVFKEISTGRVFNGTRNFCSDECETIYCNNMDQKHPELANIFELIA